MTLHNSFVRRTCVFTLAMISLGVFAERAFPCVDRTGTPEVWIQMLPGDKAKITFPGYQTFGSVAGKFCACAINPVSPEITAVTAVTFTDPGNNSSVISDFSFTMDLDTVFPGLATGAGFASSALPSAVTAGDLVNIIFEVDLQAGTTYAQLTTAFSGAGNVIGTDEADAAGAPMNTHQLVFPAGPFEPLPPVPTVSEWGIAVMALLVLLGGTIVVRRQRKVAVA